MSARVLVVDDDEASCRLVKAIFQAENIEVLMAHEGRTGLDHALTQRPDAVAGKPGEVGVQDEAERANQGRVALPMTASLRFRDGESPFL